MPWIIDIDLIAEPGAKPRTNANAIGVAGPSGYNGDGSELLYKFRMKDGDGNVYYYGRSGDDSDFGPLDDFGTPNAGCTDIEYLNEKGYWEGL
jgi:hypothetical protein